MYHDLTKGSISRSLLLFALSMIAGNMLQQLYNIADTLIVGRVLGRNALAAVGSAYALLTFLTSIFLGLSMGAGALFSIYKGKGEKEAPILHFLKVPAEVWDGMREYLLIIFAGILATSLYNFFACLLRALGNSAVPLWFLVVSALVNVGLALLFVAVWRWGIGGLLLQPFLHNSFPELGSPVMFFSNAKSSCRIGGAGFRQCLCNLCGAELRGGDLYFCGAPYENLYKCQGGGGDRMWCRLFTDRRSLLLWYRLSVFIVWILPWGEAAGNVGGSYGDLSGDAGAFGLSAFCKDRRSGDLGSHSDWMGAGRSDRTFLHAVWEKGGKYLIATGS